MASDAHGRLAAFITAGMGPIPRAAFIENLAPIEESEDLILQLAVCSECRLISSPRDFSRFDALAQRGFYVFDWTDIHRVTVKQLNVYERIAIPTTPRTVEMLVGELRTRAQVVRFEHLDFQHAQPSMFADI